MSTAPGDGDAFDELPPLDDEWVKGAAKREETAEERAARLRRIAGEHQRLQAQQEADRKRAVKQSARDKWRPWIIGGAIATALLLLFFVL